MARVNSVQTSTALPQTGKNIEGTSPFKLLDFLPISAVPLPVLCGLACFLSGLLASAVLAAYWPARAEEDDLRSFASFALGAFMCCFLLKKELPTHAKAKTQDNVAYSTLPKVAAKQTPMVPAVREERQVATPFPPCRALEMPRSLASPPGLSRPLAAMPIEAPPGLERTVNTKPPWRPRPGVRPEVSSQPPARPVRAAVVVEEAAVLPYMPQTFRKEVIEIMKALASHRNVALAVRQVRLRNVPVDRQAAELADILTYALEEVRGTVRRLHVAFVGGLASAFEKREFIAGVELFFDGVYADLCDEVPKLPKLVKIELVPTLRSVLSADEFTICVPEAMEA